MRRWMRKVQAVGAAGAIGWILSGPALAEGLGITMNGRALEASPVMSKGRVMVPLRAVFEALGARVTFDYPSQSLRAEGAGHEVSLTLGDTKAMVDGKVVPLDSPVASVEGTTLVPLRFVAEAFGARVTWNAAARIVEISTIPEFEIVPVAGFDPRVDLKRLACGNQAGVLKVFAEDGRTVSFYKGLDDRLQARLNPEDREAIREAVEIPADRVGEAVDQLIGGYFKLPRKPALALLAVLAREEWVGQEGLVKIRAFLADRMRNDKDVACRRMGALGLALVSQIDEKAVADVVYFFTTRRDNLWETFPVQQFFEYHAETIRAMPGASFIAEEVKEVNSLYTSAILRYLQ